MALDTFVKIWGRQIFANSQKLAYSPGKSEYFLMSAAGCPAGRAMCTTSANESMSHAIQVAVKKRKMYLTDDRCVRRFIWRVQRCGENGID